jgi:hypothetical protein
VRPTAAAGFAAAVVAVLLAPSLVLDGATARGGASRAAGIDVIVVSALVALPYAAVVARRLGRLRSPGEREADRWLSSLHGLVVLALAASALPAVVLHETSLLHARVVDAEWPVLLSWAALLGLAVLVSEGTRRLSARWLAAECCDAATPRVTAPATRQPTGFRKMRARPRG